MMPKLNKRLVDYSLLHTVKWFLEFYGPPKRHQFNNVGGFGVTCHDYHDALKELEALLLATRPDGGDSLREALVPLMRWIDMVLANPKTFAGTPPDGLLTGPLWENVRLALAAKDGE